MKNRLGRRRLIKAAIAGGIVAALGSAVAIVRSSGYDAPPSAQKLAALDASQYAIVQHLARRVCASDEPNGGVVTADAADVAGFVDAYVSKMPKKLKRDLLRFFLYVEQIAPASIGLSSRFTRLDPSDQDRVLRSIESSSIDLLRGGFEGVKALVFMGYYRDPRTWSILGYDGPLIGREQR